MPPGSKLSVNAPEALMVYTEALQHQKTTTSSMSKAEHSSSNPENDRPAKRLCTRDDTASSAAGGDRLLLLDPLYTIKWRLEAILGDPRFDKNSETWLSAAQARFELIRVMSSPKLILS